MNNHDLLEIALVMGGIAVTLLGTLVKSIMNLNKNIAVIVVRVDFHEREIKEIKKTFLTGHRRPT